MKKYFAKYLPVDRLASSKVELFLCCRDIQVGDTIYTGDSYLNGITITKEVFQTYTSIKGLTNPHFKVIGKISKKAIWVKENDEFDEEELRVPYRMRSFCLRSPYYEDEIINTKITDKKLKVDTNNFYYSIEVLGPCGHYH